jgi:hypothetical protein
MEYGDEFNDKEEKDYKREREAGKKVPRKKLMESSSEEDGAEEEEEESFS